MDIKDLGSAIEYVASEKGISEERALDAVQAALAAAYKKEYRGRNEIIKAKLDMQTGELKFWQVKTVVSPEDVRIPKEGEDANIGRAPHNNSRFGNSKDENVIIFYNADRHIFIEEARAIRDGVAVGDEIEFPLETHDDFGRIAAQTAKQVVLQGLREAEKDSIRDEYINKEGEIISGVVQRFERGNIFVDLGRAVGVMFHNESIPDEHCRVGQRMRFLVLAVQDEDRTQPGIILSRAHPDFILKLFELEVPEISEEQVEIKCIAREPGSRTKIAVVSYQEGIDPIGAVVGQRGTRVMAVTNELGSEKIDVIEWSEDIDVFIANSLSPAKVKLVEVLPRREARALVPEDQLSLAIGRSGQNVRLAARLTGWKIDVRSQSRPDEVQDGGVADIDKEKKENLPEAEDDITASPPQDNNSSDEEKSNDKEKNTEKKKVKKK